jgi:transcriptional regulator with XRE-family HTH domain
MAARRKDRPRWDLGSKVAHWLADQKRARAEPSNVLALARLVGVDEGTVRGWIEDGASPRSRTVRRLAEIMGADLTWLTDDAKPYPPPDVATSLGVVLKMVPAEQHQALAEILRDPVERRRWIASWNAGRGRA